jgi:hypothetical protein
MDVLFEVRFRSKNILLIDLRRCLGAISPGGPTLFLVKDLLQIRRAERLNEELRRLLESITQ